jgi:hypothetical protein
MLAFLRFLLMLLYSTLINAPLFVFQSGGVLKIRNFIFSTQLSLSLYLNNILSLSQLQYIILTWRATCNRVGTSSKSCLQA